MLVDFSFAQLVYTSSSILVCLMSQTSPVAAFVVSSISSVIVCIIELFLYFPDIANIPACFRLLRRPCFLRRRLHGPHGQKQNASIKPCRNLEQIQPKCQHCSMIYFIQKRYTMTVGSLVLH